MQTNFLELRKEAYRLWGIANHEIVYDYPQSPHYNKNGFYFKLDFSKENASWPRTYAVGRKVEHDEQVYRIIVPIIVYKKFNTFSLKTKAWYDMPKYVHDQIVEITKESRIEKKCHGVKESGINFRRKD